MFSRRKGYYKTPSLPYLYYICDLLLLIVVIQINFST